MRNFQKEWNKQVDENKASVKHDGFFRLFDAFKADRSFRQMRDRRATDQKRWWWER